MSLVNPTISSATGFTYIQDVPPTNPQYLDTWLMPSLSRVRVYDRDMVWKPLNEIKLIYDQKLWAWGYNIDGNLGLNDNAHRSSPIQVGSSITWNAVGGGYSHILGTKTDGTLWTWGKNSYGQLGLGNVISRSSPVQLGALTNWSSNIGSKGGYHSLGIKTDGTLCTWGRNDYGQLGLQDCIARSYPVQVGTDMNNALYWIYDNNSSRRPGPATTSGSYVLTIPANISAGTYQLRLHANGTWTRLAVSATFSVTSVTSTTIATQVHALAGDGITVYFAGISSPSTQDWVGLYLNGADDSSRIYWVYAGTGTPAPGGGTAAGSFAFVLPTSLAAGTYQFRLFSAGTWTRIAVSNTFTVAAYPSSPLLFVSESYGIVGNSVRVNFSHITTPTVQDWIGFYLQGAADNGYVTWFYTNSGTMTYGPSPVSANTILWTLPSVASGTYEFRLFSNGGWTRLAVSNTFSVGSIPSNNPTIDVSETSIVAGNPVTGSFGGITNSSREDWIGLYCINENDTWRSVTSGTQSTLGLKTNGTLWSWGDNSYGQLGLNERIHRSSPTQVGNLTTWHTITASGNCALGIKTDGTLWSWGYNQYGQLGLGDILYRSSPTQIGNLTNWSKIDTGANYALGIKTDGTLWGWGRNTYGQLGLGDILYRSSPTQVGNLTDWNTLITGRYHTHIIKTDGTLWAWGYNPLGMLGLNDTINRSSPVQVGNNTNWSALIHGYYYSLGITTNIP